MDEKTLSEIEARLYRDGATALDEAALIAEVRRMHAEVRRLRAEAHDCRCKTPDSWFDG